jgi:hypothetical protein
VKKSKRQLVVNINELPFRTENLGSSILQKIYGGCIGSDQFCDPNCNNNCCPGYICEFWGAFICTKK